jgi:AcrR family transcriptional regulator
MPPLSHDAKLERLLTAAAGVFARKGYHATTMRDLAGASGMSLAGMYHYVTGKEEILHLIQRGCFERVLDGARRAVAGAPDADGKVRAFVRHHVAFFAAHMSEMKVLSHEADSLTGHRDAEIRALKRRYVDLLAESLGAAGAADPRVATYALFGMMNWIYTWYRPGGRLPADRLAEAFGRIALHGAVASSAASAGPGSAYRSGGAESDD